MKKYLSVFILPVFIAVQNTVSFGQHIAAGNEHSLFLCPDSTVSACGRNDQGELGDGSGVQQTIVVHINTLDSVIKVSAKEFSSMFLKSDGTAWACGTNNAGVLGDSTTTDRFVPVQVKGLTNIIDIACGYYSLFLLSDSSVWACGGNMAGELGLGDTIDRHMPVKVDSLSGISAIACGASHSLFVKNDGTAWASGWNVDGQLGNGTTSNSNIPVQVKGLTGIVAASGGDYHSLFLKNDSTVWGCGFNGNGNLGLGYLDMKPHKIAVQIPGLTGIVAISAGHLHSLFLKSDGTVWACGENASGQFGNNTTSYWDSIPMQIPGLDNIKEISAGFEKSLFLKNDNTALACGGNAFGDLGDGTTKDKHIPVLVKALCNISVDVEENSVEDNIVIYPNPTKGNFSVRGLGVSSMAVYNLLGEKVLERVGAGDIDLSGSPKGIYYAKIYNGTGMYTRKIVIE